MMLNKFRFLAYLCLLSILTACAGLAARGRVGGQDIDTRVDSDVARYFLTNYLAGKQSDAILDRRIDDLYRHSHDGLPDGRELKRLSDEFSIDFAALYLADRIARMPLNRRFGDALNGVRTYAGKAVAEGRVKLPAAATEYEWMFVPGYLYKRYPITGADFAAPRAALQRVGLKCYLLETVEDGAVESNARLVADIIRARASTGRRLILLSASKSGPEVAMALTRLGPRETEHVAAWINIVGALKGTPLADRAPLPEVENEIGQVDAAAVESLTTERSRRRFDSFRVPPHILVVNYFGIPLTGGLSSWSSPGFAQLKKFGPNDGLLLLADMIFPGAVTLAMLGRDHFLLDERIDTTAVALALTVMGWLENGEPASLKAGFKTPGAARNNGNAR